MWTAWYAQDDILESRQWWTELLHLTANPELQHTCRTPALQFLTKDLIPKHGTAQSQVIPLLLTSRNNTDRHTFKDKLCIWEKFMCEALGMASAIIKDLVSSISFRFSLLFGTDTPSHSLLTSNAYLTAWLQKKQLPEKHPNGVKCLWSFATANTTWLLLGSNKSTDWKPCR